MNSAKYQLPILFFGQDLDEPIRFPILDGEIALFTHGSPTPTHDNEDAIGVIKWKEETVVLVVADGLGGLPRGGDASEQVVKSLVNPVIIEGVDPVIACLEATNRSLVQGSRGNGTTVSVVTIQNRKIRSYHVGDSITMVIGQRGRKKFQTIPHSPVGIAEAKGKLDEKTAMIHPYRHVIDNMIGMSDMWVDVATPVQLADFDTVIVASDGLWDNLYRDEVVDLMEHRPLMEAAVEILQSASERMKRKPRSEFGKPDDISFIVYRPRRRSPTASTV